MWPLGLIVPLQDPTPFSPFAPERWRVALDHVRGAGFTAVELAITDPEPLDPEEIAQALEETGLRFCAITTGQAVWKEGLSLAAGEEAIRERTVARLQAHMRLAKRFGAVVIVGLLRGFQGPEARLVEGLRACTRFDPDVKLALEPLNRYETRLANTVEEALRLIERVGADNLGVLVDTFHANIEERRIGEAFRRAGDRLFHVHLADSNRWAPGQGHLDFAEVWEALEAISYKGCLVIEALPQPSLQEVLAVPERLRARWAARAR